MVRRGFAATLTAVALVACAPEVSRHSTSFTPLADPPAETIEVLQDQKVSVGPGYDRVIGRGTPWTRKDEAESDLKTLSYIAEPLK
jgi:hypothetical protein